MKTKQKILNAALQVLMDSGFAALTQTRVAEAAGVGQGHLTYHFPTRSDLLKAVVDESKTRMASLREGPEGPITLDDLREILIGYGLSPHFPRLMLALTVAADEDPSLCEWFAQTDRDTRQHFRCLLQNAGLAVEENALHTLRATVIGACLIHLQQNTLASEHTLRLVIHTAFQTLIDNARPL